MLSVGEPDENDNRWSASMASQQVWCKCLRVDELLPALAVLLPGGRACSRNPVQTFLLSSCLGLELAACVNHASLGARCLAETGQISRQVLV